MADDWITTRQAVELSGYHPDHLRRLIRRFGVMARVDGRIRVVYP